MNFFIGLNNLINRLLIFLGLRHEEKYWGVVYDSANKEPIDPVILKLISVNTGKVVATTTTDFHGRYGFLTDKGKYKIMATKTHYSFPSVKVVGGRDGIYDKLYHGEFLDLKDDSDVLCFNIPMDPQAFDWNQEAKKKFRIFFPKIEKFLYSVLPIIFWTSFVYSGYFYFFGEYPQAANIFAVCSALFLLLLFFPPMRRYGRLIDKKTKLPLVNSYLELSPAAIQQVVFSRTKTTSDGKFFLRAAPGKYVIKLKEEDEKGDSVVKKVWRIRIDGLGFYNKNLYF